MVIHVRIGSVENRYTLTRLAGKARTDGIRLFRDRAGRYYASSASEAGKLHYLTGYSCDCRGFMTHQRCKHYAALMTALGWLEREPEPDPEPTPPAVSVSPCGECGGAGEVMDMEVRQFGRYQMQWTSCPTCHGSTTSADDREVA
jgi:hypothetical protein